MIVKVFLTLAIDEEEYPIPVDGFIDPEIEDTLHEYIHDIDGIKIKHIKIITQE
tara:strand:+ start:182 stop:343 length:162 start_codon:yes stop_codon:yes gene_type:complete